jgi:hypothetical protein
MLLLATAIGRETAAASGSWSNLGPVMEHKQPSPQGSNPPIAVGGGYIYVSDRVGVNKMSLTAPTSWEYLVKGQEKRIGKVAVNALGNPVIGDTTAGLAVWNGSKFTVSSLSPAAGHWYMPGGIALDPATGDIYTAGNFTMYKSKDNGLHFNKVSDLIDLYGGPNGSGGGYILTVIMTPWGELLMGGESDAIYSSLDGGVTWFSLPKFPKIGNRYGMSPTKDGELLFSTAYSDHNYGDDYFTLYTADGTLVPATSGLPPGLMNDQSSAVLTLAYLADSGENFVVGTYRADRSVHCLKWDGKSWTNIESLPNGPGAGLLRNSVGADASNVYVSTRSGQVKKWTPATKLPFRVSAGANQSVRLNTAVSLAGMVSPAGKYTYRWTARGSKNVTFADASALATTAKFSQAGHYALNIKVTNAESVTAGTTILVHVR